MALAQRVLPPLASQQNPLLASPSIRSIIHFLALGPVGLGVVSRVLSAWSSAMESLSAPRGKKIPHDRAISLVPLSLGNTDFLSDDDGEELAPEGKSRDG